MANNLRDTKYDVKVKDVRTNLDICVLIYLHVMDAYMLF